MDKQMIYLKIVDTTQEFRELKYKWNSLLEQCSNPNVFLSWEWLFTWWEFYSASYQLCILLALDQEEDILGIAPLCLSRTSKLKLKTLRFIGTEEVCSDHLDFILKEGREKETLTLFFKYFEDNPKEWDLLDLTDFREDSFSLSYMQAWAEKNRFSFSVELWTLCPYALLPDTWEGFLSGLSSNARKDIRRQIRLFGELKDVKYSFVKARDDVLPKMERLFYLHTKRWSTLGQEGVFHRERFNRFHVKISELLFNKGWLFLSYLASSETIFAICYTYRYSDKLYGYQFGLDPDWKAFSPGTVLMARTTESAISQGIKEFDFLRGEAPYKHKWAENERKNVRVLAWNRNFKSAIHRNFLSFLAKSKKLVKRYAPDFVIKVLKFLWRKAGLAGE